MAAKLDIFLKKLREKDTSDFALLYSNPNSITISNTATATSLLSAPIVFKANKLKAGDIISMKMFGKIGTAGTAPTGTIAVTLGGSTLINSIETLQASLSTTTGYFTLEVYILIKSIGATGSAILLGNSLIKDATAASAGVQRALLGSAVVINTTVDINLTATYQFSAASTSNIIISEITEVKGISGSSAMEIPIIDYNDRLLAVENKISQIYPYSQILYGVERTRGSANPAFTAIGNADQHTNLPIHKMIRACKAGEDRKIKNYLNQTNWYYNENGTASVLDGSDSLDVMLHYPHIWAVLDGAGTSGIYERWIISNAPFTYDGDVAIEIKSYLDAPDFCTVQASTNKIKSVRNETADFAGSGSLTTAGGLGYPKTVISRYNNEIYAGNKGPKWKAWYYRDHLVLAAFMYIEYKTKNLKSVFGSLGANWSSANWTAYNNSYPVRKIFETHLALSGTSAIVSKGHLTGTFTKHFEFLNGATPVVYDTAFGIYRGKVLWGDIWKWVCGIEYEIQSDASGALSNCWIQFNPDLIDANRLDSSFIFKDTYTLMGTAPRVTGYSKSTNLKSKQTRELGGGETTHDCMYFYTAIPTSGIARRGVSEGGLLHLGSSAAFGSSPTSYAPSFTSSNLGVGCRADVDE